VNQRIHKITVLFPNAQIIFSNSQAREKKSEDMKVEPTAIRLLIAVNLRGATARCSVSNKGKQIAQKKLIKQSTAI
jgi:hypothetical protein